MHFYIWFDLINKVKQVKTSPIKASASYLWDIKHIIYKYRIGYLLTLNPVCEILKLYMAQNSWLSNLFFGEDIIFNLIFWKVAHITLIIDLQTSHIARDLGDANDPFPDTEVPFM